MFSVPTVAECVPRIDSKEISYHISSIDHSNEDHDNIPPLSRRTKLNLGIVYFSEFLDNMGVSVIQPILPYYAESFNASPVQLGFLFSSYAAMCCLATIFMGRMSDRYGRRKLIIFSLFGTMFGFLLHGFARNYTELLLYRFITGAFGGSYTIVTAYVTDIVPEKQRSTYLAAASAFATCSYIIGPGIGSALVQFGLRVPFFASSVLGFIGLIFAIFFLQESHPKFQKHKKQEEEDTNSKVVVEQIAHSILPLTEKSSVPMEVWIIFFIYFLPSLSFSTFTTIWSLYNIEKYNIPASELGLFAMVSSIIYVFHSLVIFNFMTKKIGYYFVCCLGYILLAVALLVCTFVSNFWVHVAIVVYGVGAGFGIIAPAITSMTADFTNKLNRGKILGLIAVAYDLAIVIGPIIHGLLFEIDIRYPFFGGGIYAVLGLFVLIAFIVKYPQTRICLRRKKIIQEFNTDNAGNDKDDERNNEEIDIVISFKDGLNLESLSN